MPRDKRPADMDSYKEKRDKRRKQSPDYFSYFVISVIFVVIVLYIGQAVVNYMDKPEISVGSVTIGTIDLPQILDGIIIRDEKVYKTNTVGIVSFNCNDNERVKKGGIVCVVIDKETEEILTQSLAEIDSKILSIQGMRSDLIVSSAEVEQKNKQIKKIVDSGVPRLLTNGVSSVYDFKDSVSQTIDIRNQMLLTEGHGSVKDMVDTKTALDEKLKNAKAIVKADSGGIVSYLTDGLEETLTFDTMETLQPEQVRFGIDYSKLKAAYEVNPDDKLFKVVESNEWYVAAYIPNDQILDWLPGSDKTIYIENVNQTDVFSSIEMRVAKIVKGESSSFVLLKCDRYMIEYLNTRNIRFKTFQGEYKGYKIPKQAIVDRTVLKIPNGYILENDNGYFVMKRVNGVDSLTSIKLSSAYDPNESSAYVLQDYEGLKLGDVIVKGGEESEVHSVAELDNIKGLYIVNRGYAEFCRIYIDENTPESGGYYILDTGLNSSIKISDKVIMDARNVQDGQIIY